MQPRLDPHAADHLHAGMEDLLDWRKGELRPALKRISKGDQTEVVGPYCRWCVRKPECATFRSYKSTLAADIFDDGLDILNT